MRLFDDIVSRLPLEEDLVFDGVKYVIFDGSSGYFESIEGVASFAENEIALIIKKGALKIKGNKLTIKKYSGKDLIISGQILSVERLNSWI